MGSTLLGVLRLTVYGLFTVVLMPVQAIAVVLRLPLRTALPRWYHRICTRILGLDLEIRGTPSGVRPTLFVANHASYLDIMVLGAIIPGSFVAKREVRDWPFFGWLARLQRTVFVDRRPSAADAQRTEIRSRLAARENLILFPEGTSSDGNRTLPFKSALFAAAGVTPDAVGGGKAAAGPDPAAVTVQPVSIACTALDGIPLGRWLRPVYAWYGDMDLASHIWEMVRLGRLTVVVEFHDPVAPADFASRKALAEHCRARVADGMSRALAGRDGDPAERRERRRLRRERARARRRARREGRAA
ncbi:MAG: lysophospholipid acyltransferase family protein [Azospirillaceae bacterium]